MDFELLADKLYVDSPDKEYVNECCAGGDDILESLRPDIAGIYGISKSSVEVYQEDWGWALEFEKEDVFYHMGASNNESEGERSLFHISGEANRKEKGWIFTKKVPAEAELAEFARAVIKAAATAGFEIRESDAQTDD